MQVFFLTCLKIAEIKPLYKKEGKTSMTYYKPVSLLRVFIRYLILSQCQQPEFHQWLPPRVGFFLLAIAIVDTFAVT